MRRQETFTKTSSFCSLALGQQTLRCILQDLRGLVAGYMAVIQHGYLGTDRISCSWQPLIKTQSGIIQVPKCVKRPWGNNTCDKKTSQQAPCPITKHLVGCNFVISIGG